MVPKPRGGMKSSRQLYPLASAKNWEKTGVTAPTFSQYPDSTNVSDTLPEIGLKNK
jgi:hypothetical protein